MTKESKKPGRPRSENPRNVIVKVGFTQAEMDLILSQTAYPAEYIRGAAIAAASHAISPVSKANGGA